MRRAVSLQEEASGDGKLACFEGSAEGTSPFEKAKRSSFPVIEGCCMMGDALGEGLPMSCSSCELTPEVLETTGASMG
jgi:hypothetical protein